VKYKVSYITTLAAAMATARGIAERQKRATTVKSLQEYHKEILSESAILQSEPAR
jgi:carbamoyl-phosphate synthase large subunit